MSYQLWIAWVVSVRLSFLLLSLQNRVVGTDGVLFNKVSLVHRSSENALPYNGPRYLILSAPSQASTLVSSLIESLPDMNVPRCVLKRCGGAQEFLNPLCACKRSVLPALRSCMGTQMQPSMFNIWREECEDESQWPIILDYIHSENITFGKDNFSPLKLERLQKAGFTLMVSWRPPWFTFPTGFYSIMHDALCNGTNIQDSDILLLRQHALNYTCDKSVRKNILMPKHRPYMQRHVCGDITTHYVFFYKLITSAWRLHVPVVDVSKLMRLRTPFLKNYIAENFPSSLISLPGVLDHLVNMTLTARDEKVHGNTEYQPQDGTSLSEHILQKKLELFKSLQCDELLSSMSALCEESLQDCKKFNDYYFEMHGKLTNIYR